MDTGSVVFLGICIMVAGALVKGGFLVLAAKLTAIYDNYIWYSNNRYEEEKRRGNK